VILLYPNQAVPYQSTAGGDCEASHDASNPPLDSISSFVTFSTESQFSFTLSILVKGRDANLQGTVDAMVCGHRRRVAIVCMLHRG
jgi:hypothetical protein